MQESEPKKPSSRAKKSRTTTRKTTTGKTAAKKTVTSKKKAAKKKVAKKASAKKASATKTAPTTTTPATPRRTVSVEERRHMIAEAAYRKAYERQFRNGSPQQDWLDAEAEVDARLADMGAEIERGD